MSNEKEKGFVRLRAKLKDAIHNNRYYEAHQIYKTLHFRLSAQQKYDELIELLEAGARLCLENNQLESGGDLAKLLVDTLIKARTPVTEEWIRKVIRLFEMMNPEMPEREAYVGSATRWAIVPDDKFAHPLLHQEFAKTFWKEKNYGNARKHFIFSSDSKNFARMLIEIQTSPDFEGEIDAFIANAVLQILCLKRNTLAMEIFIEYNKSHPALLNMSGVPFKTKLLDAVYLILISVDKKNVQLFNETLETYESSLEADPAFKGYLEKIGYIQFGIPIAKSRNASIFDNIFQSLLNEFDTDMESEVSRSAPTVVKPPSALRDSMQDLE